ncbi:MAG TPA: hypothetical protein VKZ67_10000 [Natronosporangium sp.]|jgi:hypothetical protein|nr:hypothetical protein [Natronosporangium sp.]
MRRWRRWLRWGVPYQGFSASWVAKQAALAGVLGALLALLVYLQLRATGQHVPFGQLWALATALVLLAWLMVALERAPGPPPPPADTTIPPALPFPQVARWERRLLAANDDPEWYERVVRDRIRTVVADRLRLRHGIRLATEPERARAVLGDPLYEFLTQPLTHAPDPVELARLLTRMEEL